MLKQKFKSFGGGPSDQGNAKFQKLKKPEADLARVEKAERQAKRYQEETRNFKAPDDGCVC